MLIRLPHTSSETHYIYEDVKMRDGFHWSDGMYFRRLQDGAVEITQTQNGGKTDGIEWQRVIPSSEWAAIVAAVSLRGEAYDTSNAALDFHNRHKL